MARPHGIVVRYGGMAVGECAFDPLVEGKAMLEPKVARTLAEVHAAQCGNSLKATGPRICLHFNFAKPRLEIRRFKHAT